MPWVQSTCALGPGRMCLGSRAHVPWVQGACALDPEHMCLKVQSACIIDPNLWSVQTLVLFCHPLPIIILEGLIAISSVINYHLKIYHLIFMTINEPKKFLIFWLVQSC